MVFQMGLCCLSITQIIGEYFYLYKIDAGKNMSERDLLPFRNMYDRSSARKFLLSGGFFVVSKVDKSVRIINK
jgi:hypothetical protein